MKPLLILSALCLHSIFLTAQNNSDLKADSALIIETALNYGDGWYSGDAARMERAIHPEYRRASAVILPATGKTFIQRDAAGSITEAVRAKLGALTREKWDIQIQVLDIMDGLAFAELKIPVAHNYVQLAKIDGEWKIINILRKPAATPVRN